MSVSDSKKSSTDWDYLNDPSDEGIDYSDIPPLDESFFSEASWRFGDQESVTLRLDRDVVSWFEAQGDRYQERINAILRAYKKAHESA